jgi:hypothetical protein
MASPPDDAAPPLAALASRCVTELPANPTSFHHDVEAFRAAFEQLVAAVSRADARYAFDRDGRPAAVQAVKGALPAMEADLLDAILEDVECELAALKEALYQMLLTTRA